MFNKKRFAFVVVFFVLLIIGFFVATSLYFQNCVFLYGSKVCAEWFLRFFPLYIGLGFTVLLLDSLFDLIKHTKKGDFQIFVGKQGSWKCIPAIDYERYIKRCNSLRSAGVSEDLILQKEVIENEYKNFLSEVNKGD